MAKKQDLFLLIGVAEPHNRLNKLGDAFTERDSYVVGIYPTESETIEVIRAGKWDFPYLAIESTKMSTQGNRKIVRWYSTADGIPEACDPPEDLRSIASLTY